MAREAESAARVRGVTCPTCRGEAPWHGNAHRPFCSLTCRLIDLGYWLDEHYRIEETRLPDDVP